MLFLLLLLVVVVLVLNGSVGGVVTRHGTFLALGALKSSSSVFH